MTFLHYRGLGSASHGQGLNMGWLSQEPQYVGPILLRLPGTQTHTDNPTGSATAVPAMRISRLNSRLASQAREARQGQIPVLLTSCSTWDTGISRRSSRCSGGAFR